MTRSSPPASASTRRHGLPVRGQSTDVAFIERENGTGLVEDGEDDDQCIGQADAEIVVALDDLARRAEVGALRTIGAGRRRVQPRRACQSPTMRMRGFEPPRPFGQCDLNASRLPSSATSAWWGHPSFRFYLPSAPLTNVCTYDAG